MTRSRLLLLVPSSCLVLAFAACGGSKKPAAAPEAPAAAESAAPASSSSSAPEAPASAAPEASAAPASDDSGSDAETEKPSQPPIDLITQTDEAFVLNFQNSDIGDKAEKECKSGNPAKAARCKKKKRSKFLADVLQFEKKGKKVIFRIYKRRGKTLTKLSVDEVKLTQKSDNTVTVEVTHKGRMPRLLFTHTKKFEVVVPNDYSIRLKDPKYGKLVYDGKVGILGK